VSSWRRRRRGSGSPSRSPGAPPRPARKATGTGVDEILQAWAGGEGCPRPHRTRARSRRPRPEPARGPQPRNLLPNPHPNQLHPQPAPACAWSGARRAPPSPPVLAGPPERPLPRDGRRRAAGDPDGAARGDRPVGAGAATRSPELGDRLLRCRRRREGGLSEGGMRLLSHPARPGGGGRRRARAGHSLRHQPGAGVRRYGPDLAHIGSRVEDTAALGNALTGGLAGHPRYGGLSDRDLSDLVAYLAESR
jgi:hypothetical protein